MKRRGDSCHSVALDILKWMFGDMRGWGGSIRWFTQTIHYWKWRCSFWRRSKMSLWLQKCVHSLMSFSSKVECIKRLNMSTLNSKDGIVLSGERWLKWSKGWHCWRGVITITENEESDRVKCLAVTPMMTILKLLLLGSGKDLICCIRFFVSINSCKAQEKSERAGHINCNGMKLKERSWFVCWICWVHLVFTLPSNLAKPTPMQDEWWMLLCFGCSAMTSKNGKKDLLVQQSDELEAIKWKDDSKRDMHALPTPFLLCNTSYIKHG